jgi:hypothetical protein
MLESVVWVLQQLGNGVLIHGFDRSVLGITSLRDYKRPVIGPGLKRSHNEQSPRNGEKLLL